MRPMISIYSWALLLAFSVSCLAENQTLKIPKPIPEFQLFDQYQKKFGVLDLKGRWSMIFIGFTTCPDVCPFTLANLEAVRADLGLRLRPDHIPNIIFLAVDPDRDTAILKDYLSYFHPSYIGITGSTQELDKLVEGLDGFYRLKRENPQDKTYDVVHSARVSIINPDAEIVATIDPPFSPHNTGEYLINIIRGKHDNQ